jgi:hypothetical protein
MRINGRDIYITRGDSETFNVILYDEIADEQRNFVEGEDTVYFTVKASTQTANKIFQKIITTFEDGEAVIHIEPVDTRDLKYHEYVYDVQMVKNGSVTTIIRPAKFVVDEEVTYEP